MLDRFICGFALAWLALTPVAAASPEPDLPARIERLARDYPSLLETRETGGVIGVRSFDEDLFGELLDRIRAGAWNSGIDNACRVVFAVFSEEQGIVAAEGRQLLHEVVAAAIASEQIAVLEGLTHVLVAIMDDAISQYSVLAQELLSEKLRCAAISLGNRSLLEAIQTRVDPEREFSGAAPRPPVQGRWPLHRHANLYDIAARGDQVAAVGAFGTVLVSNDAGGSWSPARTGSDATLFAVTHGPGEELWAVGQAGSILHSTNAGASFAASVSPFDRHLFGVFAMGSGSALMVGDYGLQLRAKDGGRSWSCIPRGEDVILGRLVRAGDDAFGVGEFGTLERWPAEGGAPTPGRVLAEPRDPYLFDVWFEPAGRVGLAVGLAGTLLRTVDAGQSWRRVELAFDGNLYAVGGAGQLVVIAGEGGFLAVSRDQGTHFERVASEMPALPLMAVAFSDPVRGYVVGAGGLILKTDDGARSFHAVHPPARR